MPCVSNHCQRSDDEAKNQRVARLYRFALGELEQPIPPWVEVAANDYYGRGGNRAIPLLCRLIKDMSDEQRVAVVYNARNKESRDLANWWEEHQELDRARVEREQDEQRRLELKREALRKLTPEEREALGL